MIHKIPDLRGEDPVTVFVMIGGGIIFVVAIVALISACCYFAGC